MNYLAVCVINCLAFESGGKEDDIPNLLLLLTMLS